MAEDGADKRIDAPRGWKLGLRVASGVALLAMVVHYANPRALLGQLSNADPLLFVAAVMVAIAANVASALRWAAIARALDLVAPRARLIWMYARGITVNVLLPGATLSGDLLRSYQLSRLGNPLMRSALSVFFDRFSGLWVLCAMSLCATLVM
ncbi:MAG TPA: lysylphosphatidylglycerol synthase domain-containing protein, partial [Burkholderiales bacterium]|nr:lysylphosphatidylglycerol synthase domain-containing protein [Burkholderiales bacterium]